MKHLVKKTVQLAKPTIFASLVLLEGSAQTANTFVQKHAAEVKHVTKTMECVRSAILERLVQIAHSNAVKTV